MKLLGSFCISLSIAMVSLWDEMAGTSTPGKSRGKSLGIYMNDATVAAILLLSIVSSTLCG